jgi:hypothetical protein
LAILISTSKKLVPFYYCLYSLFNKIRDKGKIASAGYWGGGEREGVELGGKGGGRGRGEKRPKPCMHI